MTRRLDQRCDWGREYWSGGRRDFATAMKPNRVQPHIPYRGRGDSPSTLFCRRVRRDLDLLDAEGQNGNPQLLYRVAKQKTVFSRSCERIRCDAQAIALGQWL